MDSRSLHPPRLYALADGGVLGLDRLPWAVAAMAAEGIQWIQIRAKQAVDRVLFEVVERCLARLDGTGAALWINDRPDLAALLPVAGVLLGQILELLSVALVFLVDSAFTHLGLG